MPTAHVSTYVDTEVEVNLDDFDEDELAQFLAEKGWTVAGASNSGDQNPLTYEYQLWQAMRMGRFDDVKRLVRAMVLERIERFC